jgi:hypothetical protein
MAISADILDNVTKTDVLSMIGMKMNIRNTKQFYSFFFTDLVK